MCASLVCRAQMLEQAAIGLAENKHREFASELSKALKGDKHTLDFGEARSTNQRQFLLEDNVKIFEDFLGWKKKKFNKRRSLANVFNALSGKVISRKEPVTVDVSFPLGEAVFKGKAKNSKGKNIKDTYTVTTEADVIIEAGKQGVDKKSIAKNTLTLNWIVEIKVNKGNVDLKKSNAILKSIVIKAVDLFPSEKRQMHIAVEEAIKRYYQDLQGNHSSLEMPSEWRQEINNSVLIETHGAFNISEPSSRSFNVSSRSLPAVKVFLDAEPYMPEGISRYLTHDAFYNISLSFDVNFSDDLTDVQITPVYPRYASSNLEKPQLKPYEAPPVVFVPEPEPVEKGRTFKVQVLANRQNVEISNLPVKYRNIADLTIETVDTGDATLYKYVIPAGTTLREAVRKRQELINQGIEAWISIYEDGVRVHPSH